MRSDEPPERLPHDRSPLPTRADPPALPPYSARWATGVRLIIFAIILLLAAAIFAFRS